ncbi:hypothetical protein Hanom_Chr17g01564661 [Helianthus anomalus]
MTYMRPINRNWVVGTHLNHHLPPGSRLGCHRSTRESYSRNPSRQILTLHTKP